MKKIIAWSLCAMMLMSTVGCDNKTSSEKTLNATVEGRNGEMNIEVVVNEDEILSVKVAKHSETAGIADPAINDLPKMIIDHQSVLVDTIAGCTITSQAVIDGVLLALKDGNIDISKYEKKIEVVKGETETKDSEVIIIGAGGAGLAAAVSAAENGTKVILIEKLSNIGGNTGIADGLYNAVDPVRQSANGIEDSVDQFYEDTFNGGDQKAKPELVKILTENSMNRLEWLEGMGLKLDDGIYLGTGALWPRGHYGENFSGTDYINILKKKADELGVELFTNTRATELIMKEDKVVGVKAEGEKNDYIFNVSKGVVIATGGFGFNVDMRQKYNTQWPDLGAQVLCSNAPGATGDGIVMAQNIGANLIGMEYVQFYPIGDVVTGALGDSLPGGTDTRITINKEGQRFMAEDARRDEQSRAIFAQTDGQCYEVIDADTLKTEEQLKDVQKYIENGQVIKGDTIEDLAKQIGVETSVIKETFDTFNAAVDAQNDSEFGRVLLKEKMDKAPFYMALRAPTIHHTMGGIEINENAEVLDTKGEVIKGLFAAGEVTGGIHGSNRLGGNALADTMVFGRIAGQNVAK